MTELNDNDVLVGSGRPPNRRDFLKLSGAAALAVWLGACAPKGADVGAIIMEGQKNLELLPMPIREGMGQITVTQEDYGVKNPGAIEDTATCFVFEETKEKIVLVADQKFMAGFYWHNVRVNFPESSTLKTVNVPDAQLGDPNYNKQPNDSDWLVSQPFRTMNLLFIEIQKPKNSTERVTGKDYKYTVSENPPKEGEACLCAGFPDDNGFAIGEGVKYKDTVTITLEDGTKQLLYRFEGTFIPGMEGGHIANIAGEAFAVTTTLKQEEGHIFGVPVVGSVIG